MLFESLTVVKVGGSLYDLPDLAGYLRRLRCGRALLFPGGGPTTDVVRTFDRTHRLGEEASHWLALQALSLNASFLARLLPEALLVRDVRTAYDTGTSILDPLPFFLDDEQSPQHLPHCWQVTSDSLAVRVAVCAAARELLLLKSVSWQPANDWTGAAQAGIVDDYFPEALHAAPDLHVRVINMRHERDGTSPR